MIVVTGGAGFIGSNLLAALEAGGVVDQPGRPDDPPALVCVDRLGQDDKWRNIAKRELLAIIPPESLFEYLTAHRSSIDTVFHMGAISSTVETDADLIIETNFALSQRLWRWCADNRVRLIYASSAATYGDGAAGFDDLQDSADLARLQPLNAYGWSKHLFDRWAVRQVARGYPTPPQWVGLKFFNVYGPNEYHKGGQQSVVLQIFRAVASGSGASLFRSTHPDYTDGGQRRDFVFVDDIVAMMIWAYHNPRVSGLFNAGSGQARSFLDLAQAVFAALGQPPDIRFIDMPPSLRPNYQNFTESRMDRLIAAGYSRPATGLEAGVATYVQKFLTAKDRYK